MGRSFNDMSSFILKPLLGCLLLTLQQEIEKKNITPNHILFRKRGVFELNNAC
jgi:hypothetical protein